MSFSSFLHFSGDCHLSLRTRLCHKMLNVIAKLINFADNGHHYIWLVTWLLEDFVLSHVLILVTFPLDASKLTAQLCFIIIIWFEKSLGLNVRSFWTFVSLLLWSVILEPFMREDASEGDSLVGIRFWRLTSWACVPRDEVKGKRRPSSVFLDFHSIWR